MRKCGLDEINQTPKALNDNNYAMIIDECMMIGSQKLLTMISVPAEHQGRPLQLDDARVVGFEVQTTWNAEKVKKVLEKSEGIIGKAAKYVISDNDAKMRKAINPLTSRGIAMSVTRLPCLWSAFTSTTQSLLSSSIRWLFVKNSAV